MLPLPTQFRSEERRWFGGLFLFRETAALVLNPGWILEESRRALAGSQPDAIVISPDGATNVDGTDRLIRHAAG
jgi:hypothetical protein